VKFSERTFIASSTEDDTGKYLQSIAKFSEELQIKHSPLAHILTAREPLGAVPR
jgi:hypothetical protein